MQYSDWLAYYGSVKTDGLVLNWKIRGRSFSRNIGQYSWPIGMPHHQAV